MRIIVRDEDKFLNKLYGTEKEKYGMNKKDIKNIIKDHLKSLDTIYNYLDDTSLEGIEQYDLGDVINLLYEFVDNLEFTREEYKNYE